MMRCYRMMRGTTALVLAIRIAAASATIVILCQRSLGQADFSAELPRVPATDPDDALAAFEVAQGFQIQQVASEPLVASPVAIEWDARGRMYVCEMRGYSEDRDLGISRITRLEDADHDGVYDRRTVFADNLLWPTAIFPYDDGLFVGDAPDLHYFKDTDDDGVADQKSIVLTGFGTSNVQGLMNSLRWGLDNRLHIACSSVGGTVHRPGDPDGGVNVRGRDIALDPRTHQFELTSGAAQHGMCFDDWGRKFVSSNSDHIQQVMFEDRYIARNPLLRAPSSRVSIAADGPQAEVYRISPVEPWRIVRTRLRVGGLVPGPVEGGGRAAGYFTGATGVTIYRGDAWPSEWRGTAIVGDVGSNLVHRKRLESNGLVFVARRIDQGSEFVASTDIWFRPAQFANAPDGSLHVIDVCREVIEHPKSLPPDIKRHLDLTSGRDRGRIYRIVSDDHAHRPTPNLQDATTNDLVQTLAHANAWHRETAARVLFERQDASAVTGLRTLARQSKSDLARMHALYVLDGLGKLSTSDVLSRLDDRHPQVRRHAVRLCERVPQTPALIQQLTRLARDPSIEVRYQLAFTAGAMERSARSRILTTIAAANVTDRWIATAIQSSLGESAIDVFAAGMTDSRLRTRAGSDFLARLASQIRQQDDPQDVAVAMSLLPDLPDSSSTFALPIIGALLATRSDGSSTVGKMSRAGDLDSIDRKLATLVAASIKAARNQALDSEPRTAAIQSLSFGRLDHVKSTLVQLIDDQSYQVRRTAVETLGKFSAAEVAAPMIEAWPQLSPQLRQTVTEALFTRSDRALALFDAIDEGRIPISEVAKTRLQIAAKSKDQRVRSRATRLLRSTGSPRRQDVVHAYRDALDRPADFGRGRILFRKHCAVCHQVEGVGHAIGPSLATIKARGKDTILVNVLDPNREVNPQYLNYVALTVDGRTVTGMIAAESATSITLRRAESASDTVLRVDLDQLQSTGLSLMPEGMEESIDNQAMADIIDYLMNVGLHAE